MSSVYVNSDSSDTTPLGEKLEKVFLRLPNNLNVIHLNAQSVPAHILELQATFEYDLKIDAVAVVETWLTGHTSSPDFDLPNYNLIRNDRIGNNHGGVAIYLRKNIPFKIVKQSQTVYTPDNKEFSEFLFIEILYKGSKVLLAAYYSPPSHKYLSNFRDLLVSIRNEYEHVILLGDFNTCLFKNDPRARALLDILTSNRLSVLPLEATHHAPDCRPSLLDLIIVSEMNNVAKHGQLTGGFSYHDIIYLSYMIRSFNGNSSNASSSLTEITFQDKIGRSSDVINEFLMDPIFQEALLQKIKMKKKLKRKRTKSALSNYQESRKIVTQYENKLKNKRKASEQNRAGTSKE